MESAMPKANPWSNSMSRVEIDYRAREARLRFERMEQLLVRSQTRRSWLRSVLFGLRLGRSRYRSRAGQNNGPLCIRQPRLRRGHRASRRCNHRVLYGSLRNAILPPLSCEEKGLSEVAQRPAAMRLVRPIPLQVAIRGSTGIILIFQLSPSRRPKNHLTNQRFMRGFP
jgi:hypothetical protein